MYDTDGWNQALYYKNNILYLDLFLTFLVLGLKINKNGIDY